MQLAVDVALEVALVVVVAWALPTAEVLTRRVPLCRVPEECHLH